MMYQTLKPVHTVFNFNKNLSKISQLIISHLFKK